MITVSFIDPTAKLRQHDIDLDVAPNIGDLIKLSGATYRITQKEFIIENDRIERIDMTVEVDD